MIKNRLYRGVWEFPYPQYLNKGVNEMRLKDLCLVPDKITQARNFCKEVADLAEKYDLSFFLVTEGASITRNNGVEAVRHARECHEKREKKNGHDPNEDWMK